MSIYIDLYANATNRPVVGYQKNSYIYNRNPNRLQSSELYSQYRYSVDAIAGNNTNTNSIKLANYSTNTKNNGTNKKLQDEQLNYVLDSYGSVSHNQSMRSGNFNFTTGQFVAINADGSNILPKTNDWSIGLPISKRQSQPVYSIGTPKPPALEQVSSQELEWKLFNKDTQEYILDIPPIFPPSPADTCPLLWICIKDI